MQARHFGFWVEGKSGLVLLPDELMNLILKVAIESDFASILSLRLVSSVLNELVETICLELASKLFGDDFKQLQSHLLPNSASCSFFKFTQSEVRRKLYNLHIVNTKVPSTIFGLYNHPFSNSSSKHFAELNTKHAEATCELLSQPNVTHHFEVSRNALVNSRWFEGIQKFVYLFESQLDPLDLHNFIDHIYYDALGIYSKLEFIQLLSVVPIDINRHLKIDVLPMGYGPQKSMPLLHHAASSGNAAVAQYLLECGADCHQVCSDGVSLLDAIHQNINKWSGKNDHLTKRLTESLKIVSEFLESRVDSALIR